MEHGPVLILRASPGRRVLGVASLVAVGGLMAYLALAGGEVGALPRLLLVMAGGAMILAARAMWLATEGEVRLTPRGLTDGTGRVLAEMDNIQTVDRGIFALKPSSGFVVRLRRPMPRAWAPGLWWRAGRHLGIGGAASKHDAREMADALAVVLAERRWREE